MSDRKRLLYVVYEPGDEALGYRFARHGRDSGTFDVILWTPYGLPRNTEYKAEALTHGAPFLYENNPDGSLSAFQADLSSYLAAPPYRLRQAEPRPVSETARMALKAIREVAPDIAQAALQAADAVIRRTAVIEDWIVRLGIDALVLPEENVGRDSASWIEAARLRGIPVTIVTTWVVNPDFAESAYRNDPNFQPQATLIPIFRKQLPQWQRERDDYTLTRLPPAQALGLALTGLSPPDPWCVNTHPTPRVAVESEAVREDYARHGIDVRHIVATGAPSLDALALSDPDREVLRKTLSDLAGRDASAPICLLNPPPNRHHNKIAPEFDDYESLLEAFVRRAVESWDGTLIVSPHPATSDAQRDIIRSAGGTVVDRPAIELMAAVDIYASAISSTIQMALAAALPIACYEVYRYDTPPVFMSALCGKADTLDIFGERIRALNDPERRTLAHEEARNHAQHWGRLDGRNFERVVTLAFDEEAHTPIDSNTATQPARSSTLSRVFRRSG